MALGEAMRVEYLAITDAGFILQIDDPRMATHYNRQVDASVDDCRKFIALRVETLNHALRGIPEDHVRFHTCYSVNIAPRARPTPRAMSFALPEKVVHVKVSSVCT